MKTVEEKFWELSEKWIRGQEPYFLYEYTYVKYGTREPSLEEREMEIKIDFDKIIEDCWESEEWEEYDEKSMLKALDTALEYWCDDSDNFSSQMEYDPYGKEEYDLDHFDPWWD